MGGAYPVGNTGSAGYRPGFQSQPAANVNRPGPSTGSGDKYSPGKYDPFHDPNARAPKGPAPGPRGYTPPNYPSPPSGLKPSASGGYQGLEFNRPFLEKGPGRSALYRSALRGILPRFLPMIGWLLIAYELMEFWNGFGAPNFQFRRPGWLHCPACSSSPIAFATHDTVGSCPICAQLQAVNPADRVGIQVVPPLGVPRRIIWWTAGNSLPPPGDRYDVVKAFIWPVGPFSPNSVPHTEWAGPGQVPARPNPAHDPLADPFPQAPAPGRQPVMPPAIDPMSIPPFAPMPLPIPVPWRAIPGLRPNPERSPTESTQRGPQAAPRSDPRASPNPLPQPGPSISYEPGRPPVVMQPRGDRNPKRPPRKDKEKKIKRRTIPHILKKIANFATESCDAIESLHKAIPWKDRIKYHQGKKKPSCVQQSRAVYDLFHKISWPDAVAELVKNEIEDRAYGTIGKVSGKAARHAQDTGFAPRSERGPQAGPGDTAIRKYAQDVANMVREHMR